MARTLRATRMLVVVLAARVGWVVYEFLFRHYGPGRVTGALLDATPQAAAAAGIAWMVTTFFLALVGVQLVHVLHGATA